MSPPPATSSLGELLALALGAVRSHRLRSVLSMLGIAIGIAAVILLTSIGEGTRRYVLQQFTQFGTNVLIISPGKSKTLGLPGILGGTTYPLSLDDAAAIGRLGPVEDVLPLAYGQARVEWGERGRSVLIYGVTPAVAQVWQVQVRQGAFWPERDVHQGGGFTSGGFTVLGPKLKRELFGENNPLGEIVRIAGRRFRVVGVMGSKGQMLGFDVDDGAYVPVATALKVFNLRELTEIDVLYGQARRSAETEEAVRRLLITRHGGNEDVTLLTQDAMLAVFGNVMDVITLSVGAIAGISLVVGAIGILTMMWIAVGERTSEIGLVRALGATRGQVQFLFLAEAAALALLGGLAGLSVGLGMCGVLRLLVPGLPVATPMSFVGAALVVSLVTGLLSGVLPARRAARLDPIEALRAE